MGGKTLCIVWGEGILPCRQVGVAAWVFFFSRGFSHAGIFLGGIAPLL